MDLLKKYFQKRFPSYLFLIAWTFFVAGIALIFIDFQLNALNISLVSFGSLFLYFFGGQYLKRVKISSSSDGRHNVPLTILRKYLLCFVFLFLLNAFFMKFNLRFDMTAYQQHTLSKSTQKFLKDIQGNIHIVAFYVGIPPKYLEDLFREYENNSDGKIKAEIIDPLVNLSYAARYGEHISGKEQKIIVESGSEKSTIDFTDRILSENDVNNGIIRAIRPVSYVYFLAGHGEYNTDSDKEDGLSIFVKDLAANNFVSRKLLLGVTQKIPEDCRLLIIAGAKLDLTAKEEDFIEEYLLKGGDALFLVENIIVSTPDVPLRDDQKDKNPSLNKILNKWGVSVGNDVVVDLSSHAQGDVGCPATHNYSTHRAIVSGLDYTVYIRPRSISSLSDYRSTIKLAALVLTSSENTSWAESNRYLQVKYDDFLDRKGPVPIAYVIWEPKDSLVKLSQTEFKKDSDTRVAVFTDADFLSNGYIKQYSNAQMGLNVVKWLTESDYQFFVDPKNVQVAKLELNSQQKRLVLVILLAMPLTILLIGAAVWVGKKFNS